MLAAGDVNVGAATETHELNAHETHSHSNVVSGVKVASGIDQAMTLNRGSLVSADGEQRWPHSFGQLSEIFKWNVRGNHAGIGGRTILPAFAQGIIERRFDLRAAQV